MTIKPYNFNVLKTLQDAFDALQVIARERRNDVTEINGLPNKFMLGRKVGKIPATSADVEPTDSLGDFNYDASFMYLLVSNAGVNVWRRITLGSF